MLFHKPAPFQSKRKLNAIFCFNCILPISHEAKNYHNFQSHGANKLLQQYGDIRIALLSPAIS